MTTDYKNHIRTVENFPEQGVKFFDIAPLLGNGAVFATAIEEMAAPLAGRVTKVAGFDARGFVFGGAMAVELGVGFTMLRKPGKLPGETLTAEYDLEYGKNELELQADALTSADTVVLVDDVIATGGTALAGIELIKRTGASVVEVCGLMELSYLGGADRIIENGTTVRTLVRFDS